jgi:hypothetical protein
MKATIDGIEINIHPMEDAPRDGTPILVLLEREFLKSSWHSARLGKNVSFVGNHFTFECPKMIGWLPLPVVSQ